MNDENTSEIKAPSNFIKNFIDEENWKCFVNSVYDKETKKWTCFKRAHVDLVDKSKLFK